MEKISGIVITYNEEARIEDCLKSLCAICDEIVVVDSFSTDATLRIASNYTSKIHQRKFDTFYAQKAYATALTEHDWVIWLDADERISDDLAEQIRALKLNGFTADSYKINRLNYYVNDFFKYSGWYPDAKIRLFRKSIGAWAEQDPHEKLILQPDSRFEHLKNDVIHFTYNNFHHQIDKVNKFSTHAANQKLKRNQRFVRTHFVINPLIKFIKSYFLQGGFLGGSRGFINAVIASFDVFSKYAKVWEGNHEKKPGSDLWHKGPGSSIWHEANSFKSY